MLHSTATVYLTWHTIGSSFLASETDHRRAATRCIQSIAARLSADNQVNIVMLL
jgi:hypothetical protein